MADVSSALESIGAAPQPALGPFSNNPAFTGGVKRLGELGGERKKVQEQFDKDAGGVQQKLATEQASGAALAPPKQENVSEEFKHMGMKGEELTSTLQTMFAFAAIGGAMTRAPMTAALNAFSGAMKGLVEGDKIVFAQEKDTFDRHLKTAMAKNQQARDEYKMAFDKHRGNMQDLMNEWNIIAKRHGDSVSAINMERQDIQGMLRQIESMGKMDLNMKKTDALIQQGWERIRQQDRRLDEQGRHNKESEAARQREGQIRERVAAGKAANAKAMTSIQATMYEDVATGFYRMGMLEDMAKQTGELPGGSMFLQSQMHNDGLVSAIRGYGINKTLPEGFQQTDALLLGIAFDVASARSGGRGQLSDSKIREVTRQMPLSSDTPDTRALKYKLIQNQLEVANHTLPENYQYDPKTGAQKGASGGAGAGGGWTDDKEKRYQELKAKQNAAQ